ncbi:MAG: succinate dehydrogenase [Candidatus Omnitrophica bacterium]|nr:succinate dehydrogenase [Candidatus Omnitrophota bacterium]
MSTVSPHERPLGGFELQSWVFMRFSGLCLLFLALWHFAIMHLIHPIESLNYEFVAGRYRHFGWRLYDLSMLLLALLHGLNGVRILIDDYIHSTRWYRVALWTLRGVGLFFLILGTLVILIFQPVGVAL